MEDHFLAGLRNHDSDIIREIYGREYPKIEGWIKQRGGDRDVARDIFQEALLIINKKAGAADFSFTVTFSAYLFGTCRFLWLRRQEKKKSAPMVTFDGLERLKDEYDLESTLIEREKRLLFKEKFSELGPDCRKLLTHFFAGKPLKEIAKIMGYTDDYVKKKNSRCKKKLMQNVKEDPRYAELRTDNENKPPR